MGELSIRCASVRVSRGYEIDCRGRVAPARVHARVAVPGTSSLLASGKGCEVRPFGATPSGVPTASNASCSRPTGGFPASMYTKGRPGPRSGSCELAHALASPVKSDWVERWLLGCTSTHRGSNMGAVQAAVEAAGRDGLGVISGTAALHTADVLSSATAHAAVLFGRGVESRVANVRATSSPPFPMHAPINAEYTTTSALGSEVSWAADSVVLSWHE